MNNQTGQRLEFVTSKHLKDKNSDLLYDPYRRAAQQALKSKLSMYEDRNTRFFTQLTNAKLPQNVNYLQISTDKIYRQKKFRKIGQTKVEYPPIDGQVLKILQRGKKTEQIVYKYSNRNQSVSQINYQKNKYSSLKIQRRVENEHKLRQNFDKIKSVKVKNQNYNSFSILDGPLNSLFKGNFIFCGDCSNQIIAGQKQLIYELQQIKPHRN